jgi:hypothetical protein
VYVTTSSYEQQLLQQLQYHMLHESVSEELRQQLQSAAAAGTSNLQLLSAKRLDSHVLGLLLPSQWHSSSGRDEVSWQPSVADEDTASPAGQQQPSKEFIQLCWHWLADRSDAADVSHWPLLPVTGGKLRLLMQPAQVRLGG